MRRVLAAEAAEAATIIDSLHIEEEEEVLTVEMKVIEAVAAVRRLACLPQAVLDITVVEAVVRREEAQAPTADATAAGWDSHRPTAEEEGEADRRTGECRTEEEAEDRRVANTVTAEEAAASVEEVVVLAEETAASVEEAAALAEEAAALVEETAVLAEETADTAVAVDTAAVDINVAATAEVAAEEAEITANFRRSGTVFYVGKCVMIFAVFLLHSTVSLCLISSNKRHSRKETKTTNANKFTVRCKSTAFVVECSIDFESAETELVTAARIRSRLNDANEAYRRFRFVDSPRTGSKSTMKCVFVEVNAQDRPRSARFRSLESPVLERVAFVSGAVTKCVARRRDCARVAQVEADPRLFAIFRSKDGVFASDDIFWPSNDVTGSVITHSDHYLQRFGGITKGRTTVFA